MTALEKIVKYLKSRKTGATAPEIAKYTKVNYNTVRKELGSAVGTFYVNVCSDLTGEVSKDSFRKCRVTGKTLTTYQLV